MNQDEESLVSDIGRACLMEVGYLKLLNLYSVQRRQGSYQIIYLWKIIEVLVPNLSTLITCTYSERRGRSCVVSHVNMGQRGTLSYNSFRWRSIRMFNKLPKYLNCLSENRL